MKVLMVGLCFSFLYVGCGEIENDISNSKINSDKNVIKETVSKDLLKELGFDLGNEKISIDINKTTNFFKKMEIEMHGKADEIQHKIERADINFTRDIGIVFSDEKVEIDLNKTKNMFQQLNILMKELLVDKNSSKN